MGVQIFLNFNGNCREAAEFYSGVFMNEPPQFMTFAQGPADEEHPVPPDALDLIMYTEILVEGDRIMLSDIYPGMEYTVGNNVNLTVICRDIETATGYFNRMKEKGTVEMELQETFWSPMYGSVKDDFGIVWQFDAEPKDKEFSVET